MVECSGTAALCELPFDTFTCIELRKIKCLPHSLFILSRINIFATGCWLTPPLKSTASRQAQWIKLLDGITIHFNQDTVSHKDGAAAEPAHPVPC